LSGHISNDFLIKWHKSKSQSVVKYFEIKINNHFESDLKSKSKDRRIVLNSRFKIKIIGVPNTAEE